MIRSQRAVTREVSKHQTLEYAQELGIAVGSPTDDGFIDQNIEVNHLPRHVDNLLKTLAHLRGMTKKAIVREALIEYVSRHREEVTKLVGGKTNVRQNP